MNINRKTRQIATYLLCHHFLKDPTRFYALLKAKDCGLAPQTLAFGPESARMGVVLFGKSGQWFVVGALAP